MTTRYWVNTVSLEHVELGVAGGFTQADHGRATRLRKLAVGDGIAFYSPRTAMRSGAPLQRLTAVGTVTGKEPYQVEISTHFHPWRLRVDFEKTGQADVRPILDDLGFVTDKQHWGMPFRRGLFEIPADDFAVIVEAMRAAAPPA
ncbi:MAG: EVE domain-containing protein [Marmoricola sp.]